jgi:pimeloyl-ACP methyl ester carboxylesterase
MDRAAADFTHRSLFENAKLAVDVIIRPFRTHYDLDSIDPIHHTPNLPPVPQIPMQFQNRYNKTIVGSFYPSGIYPTEPIHRAIIYAHGNEGCQYQGRWMVPYFAPHGISLFLFDSSGSGESEGEFVSLGLTESDDLFDTMNFLSDQLHFTEFVLAGRSMGAAAVLLAAPRHPWVKGVIVDSSFSSLNDLFFDVCARLNIPRFLRPIAVWWVKREVMNKSGLDCNRVSPIEAARNGRVPLLLGHSVEDELIPYSQGMLLFQGYAAEKEHVQFTGRHNEERPREWTDACVRFVANVFRLEREHFQETRRSSCDWKMPHFPLNSVTTRARWIL